MKALLAVLLTFSLLVVGSGRAIGQDGEDCDPQEVTEWLMQRQAWRNATAETYDKAVDAKLSWDALPSLLNETHRHMQAIADLERPACADDALLWTYYFYDAWARFFICRSQGDDECQTEMQQRLTNYSEQIDVVMAPLLETAGITPEDHEVMTQDLRPEGWIWPPETLRAFFPATYVEGALDFEGSGDLVSDPVTLPAGIYRVSLETQDTSMSVDMVIVSGDCSIGSSSWDTTVFDHKGNGAQSLITSNECDVIWQVTDSEDHFKVVFQQIG